MLRVVEACGESPVECMTVENDPQQLVHSFQEQLNNTLELDAKPNSKLFEWLRGGDGRSDKRIRFDSWCKTHYLDNQLHRVLYCPIEKNACTYFRENMLLHSEYEREFVNSKLNPHAFIKKRKRLLLKNLEQLSRRDYLKFVIVREPLERIVSAYANKFVRNRKVKMAVEATRQYANINPVFDQPRKLLTFRMFVHVLASHNDPLLDHHWRSQISFVAPVVDQFDWLVPMNRINDFLPILEKRFHAELSREKTANRNEYQSQDLEERLYDKFPARLRQLDQMPGVESMVSPELRTTLENRFQLDFEFYQLAQAHFDAKLAELNGRSVSSGL